MADYAAGSGYFTRLFAAVVGPAGHVYASAPSGLFKYPNIVKGIADIETYAAANPNVTVTFGSALDAARYPEKLDVFWISQNYHDLPDKFMGPVDMVAFNRAVYAAALKPGGTYLVLDHRAAPGSPPDVTETLHRIEPSVVRREVEAAGFKFTSARSGSPPLRFSGSRRVRSARRSNPVLHRGARRTTGPMISISTSAYGIRTSNASPIHSRAPHTRPR